MELSRIPTPLEIRNTIWGMDSQKASGPNGLPALFYKKYWNIVGDSVVKEIINFFESGKMLNELNSTLTVLIPRIQNPNLTVSIAQLACAM